MHLNIVIKNLEVGNYGKGLNAMIVNSAIVTEIFLPEITLPDSLEFPRMYLPYLILLFFFKKFKQLH